MGKRFTSLVVQRVARIQGLIGESTRDLSDDQLVRWLAPTAPSAAWHLWHIARWADRIHSVLPRMLTDQDPTALTKEIWDAESLAEQWGLDPSVLGYGQAGTDMEDRVARSMTFPPKATLQDYARRAFAAVEGVFGTVEEDQLAPIRK